MANYKVGDILIIETKESDKPDIVRILEVTDTKYKVNIILISSTAADNVEEGDPLVDSYLLDSYTEKNSIITNVRRANKVEKLLYV